MVLLRYLLLKSEKKGTFSWTEIWAERKSERKNNLPTSFSCFANVMRVCKTLLMCKSEQVSWSKVPIYVIAYIRLLYHKSGIKIVSYLTENRKRWGNRYFQPNCKKVKKLRIFLMNLLYRRCPRNFLILYECNTHTYVSICST